MSGKSSTIQRPAPPRASDRGRSRLGDVTRPVPIDRRIATRRRSTIAVALAAVAIAGALAAALFVLPVRTYLGQDDQIERQADQLAQLEAVNDDLRTEVERLRSDEGVAEAAREELGMIAEGERRETIMPFPEVPTDLPGGWPYDLVTGIVELRRNPPPVDLPTATSP